MPQIYEKNKERNNKTTNSQSGTFNREEVKAGFGYFVVGTGVLLALWGVGYSFVKQIRKD